MTPSTPNWRPGAGSEHEGSSKDLGGLGRSSLPGGHSWAVRSCTCWGQAATASAPTNPAASASWGASDNESTCAFSASTTIGSRTAAYRLRPLLKLATGCANGAAAGTLAEGTSASCAGRDIPRSGHPPPDIHPSLDRRSRAQTCQRRRLPIAITPQSALIICTWLYVWICY